MQYNIYLGMYKQEIVDTDLTFCQGDYGEELVIHGISDSRTARIVFRKPDGNTVERTNLTKDNDVYKYTLQVAELQAIGTVIADVKFTDASSRESSQKFKFTVKPDTINDSVKDSGAWSDSIEQAKTQFAAALVDALTDVENNTAQKIAYANNQLTQLIDTITAECRQATENANAVVTQKTGINDSESSKTETYSSDKIESIKTAIEDKLNPTYNTMTTMSNNLKLITYTDLANIGLTSASLVKSTEDVATVVNAMSDKSMMILTFASGQFGLPTNDNGTIEIKKHNVNRTSLIAVGGATKSLYYGSYHSTNGFSGWYKIDGTLFEETSFNFAGGTFHLKRTNSTVLIYSNDVITEDIAQGWVNTFITFPQNFRPTSTLYVHFVFLYGKRIVFRIEPDGALHAFAAQNFSFSSDDKWIQSSATYLL